MALQTSGAISFANIQTEFGGSNPISLSEYYGGGANVPAGANPGIATSGAINMNSFYGGVAATVLNITSSVNNYDIGAHAIAAGGDKSTPVILTINAGVTVGSTSTSTAAMFTGTGWSSGTTINITNNGSIVGASGSNTSAYAGGGNGGNGGYHSSWIGSNGAAGSAGGSGSDSVNNAGNAFYHSQTANNNLSVVFDTTGTRTGGSAGYKTSYGGGGGGGGGDGYSTNFRRGGGGGGGAGSPGGTGGAVNHNVTCCGVVTISGGFKLAESGTLTTGGRATPNFQRSGYSGAGGSNGNSGGNGNYSSSGGAGGSNTNTSGAAGSALAGNTGQIS